MIGQNKFDETFTNKEIELIDAVITKAIKEKDFISEKELHKTIFG